MGLVQRHENPNDTVLTPAASVLSRFISVLMTADLLFGANPRASISALLSRSQFCITHRAKQVP